MKKRFLPLGLGIALIAGVVAAFATGDAGNEAPEETADTVVLGEVDLAERAEILRNQFRRMTPGEGPLVQDVGAWPAAWDEFGPSWDAAPAERDLATWLVPFISDRAGALMILRDANGTVLWNGATDFAKDESASVTLTGSLVDEEEWPLYEAAWEEVERRYAEAFSPVYPSGMRGTNGPYTNGLRFTDISVDTNGDYRLDFACETNGDVQVFCRAMHYESWTNFGVVWTNDENEVITNDVVNWAQVPGERFNGTSDTWDLLGVATVTNGIGSITDTNHVPEYDRVRFYAAAELVDMDGDGLTDGEEWLISHSNPAQGDTDGDGWVDGLEVAAGFDPLDEMEHPKVMIQAVMYKPTLNGDTNEWVELYSASKRPVPLAGARLEIGRTGEWVTAVAFTNGEVIAPGRCLLVGGSAVTNVDVPAVLDIPDSGPLAPMTGVRLAWGAGAALTVADAVMIGGDASNFNADGLDTTGWLSEESVWSSSGNILERRYAGVDTDRKADWGWWGQRPGRNSEEAVDSDNDGLSDGEELLGTANPWNEPTNPLLGDTDGDGLTDAEECLVYGTNPLTWASDGDIYPWMPGGTVATNWPGTDSYELAHGHDPLDFDENTNGIPDSWEWVLGTENLLSGADSDGDGTSDLDEMRQNSNPTDSTHSTPEDFVMVFQTTLDNWVNGAPDNDIGLGGRVEVTFWGATPGSSIGVQVSEGMFPEPFTMKWEDADVIFEPKGNVAVQGFASAYARIQPYGPRLSLSYPRLIVQDARLHPESGENAGGEYDIQAFTVRLVPDYDRNHAIDAVDRAAVAAGTPFRWWINDDDDDGDIADDDSDVPGQSSPANCDNGQVDGRSDLLDFFPVWLDVESLLEFMPPGNGTTWKLRHADGAVRVAYTDLAAANVGDFLFVDSDAYGANADETSCSAQTVEISPSGTTLPPAFLSRLPENPFLGVLLVEGSRNTEEPLVLEIDGADGILYETALPLRLSGVEDFYRRVCLIPGHVTTNVAAPANWPDELCGARNIVFVHGFNVTSNEARGWHSEIFKRFHQSGSDAKFWGVTWYGDEGLINELHYHEDVVNAFEAAGPLADALRTNATGPLVLMAHSLGNLVVSSAIRDHGLVCEKYFMFNAAVPAEAYDASLRDETPGNPLVHDDWKSYTNVAWASKWHELFPAADARAALTWSGWFSDMTNQVYNYYSSGDEVLEVHSSPVSIWGGGPSHLERYASQKQELNKGRLGLIGTAWAGWGFAKYTQNDHEHRCYTAAQANQTAQDDPSQFCSAPVFRRAPDFLQDSSLSDIQIRQLLAKGIPALSAPAGSRQIENGFISRNLNSFLPAGWPNGWGRNDSDYGNRWLHGDLKAMAFFFIYPVFSELRDTIMPSNIQ